MKKLTKQQADALYKIGLDGGLMRTIDAEYPYTTVKGRPIHAITAKWLIDHDHLLAHQDGFVEGMSQSWEVKRKLDVV